jgi:iron complex outermembrane receptor protein
VTRVPTTAPLAAISPPPPLFDRINILTFEEGTPKDKYSAAVNWSRGTMGATLRAIRYGEVLDPGTSAALDATLSAKTVADLEFRVELFERFRVALGAENVFDEYPDTLPVGVSNATNRNATGNTPFSNYSPFGRGGRFIYGRVNVRF